MLSKTIKHWLTVAALLACSLAMAQAEPTLKQVYETARSGKLEEAQVMILQVLVAHPDSAKAHFVQAELSAQAGKMSRARDALAQAEKLAPGLPFAQAATVQKLRAQLAAKGSTEPVNKTVGSKVTSLGATAVPAAASPFPWGLGLALGGGAIALVMFLKRKNAAAPAPTAAQPFPAQTSSAQNYAPQPYAQPAAPGSGLSGPQTFGTANASMTAGSGPANSPPAYGQPASYGQAAGSGLGGRVMGGLATGLAVGAGVMAAEAIGKSLMGNRENPAHAPAVSNNFSEPAVANNDLGGQNFGVADTGSWDDNSSANGIASSDDVGGDWDS